MAKFDHHVHTARHSPDSVIDPLVLLERAKRVGLDGVVITEHDYQWEAGELAELAAHAAAIGLRVFSGVEVSAREGHFLVYGLPDPFEAPPGIALKDLLRVTRRRGAAVVAAHPFRWDQDFERIVAEHGPAFDALELVSNNVTPETRTGPSGSSPATRWAQRFERRPRARRRRLLLHRLPRRDHHPRRIRRRPPFPPRPTRAHPRIAGGERAGRLIAWMTDDR